ncbi:MAG: (Fe-S)-binding protein, partial [Actinobacteria bacterium]|nr:(Fe-S)-binding protein [Actinomycetota bacterium]
VFDYKKCIRCYCCSEMCPEGAIDLNYSWFGNLIFREKKIK